jgi:hypothetical protein
MNDRENILNGLREKPLKIFEVMKRANISDQEACQTLLMKMRDEGLLKFRYSRWSLANRVIEVSTLGLRE